MCSAEDEMLHISPHFHDLHNQYCELHPEAFNEEHEAVNYGLKFRVIKRLTKGKIFFLLTINLSNVAHIDEIKERFFEVEVWSIFDAAFCYHRCAFLLYN